MSAQPKVVGGRYELVSVIGRGGMSVVWLATDRTLGKQWAVKEISLSNDRNKCQLIVDSLVREANLLKRLDHPAIPRIVDLIDEDGILYVVMDFIEGKTLESILTDKGPQAEDDVVAWTLQLCDVLDYLHQGTPSIVYRDLKPSNVMLKPDGTVRLIDFGIACEEGTVVEVGALLGSRGFAAPEQVVLGGMVNRRTDVYGLGATMYNLLTGELPPASGEVAAPVRQRRPELSQAVENVVSKAMQKDPEKRYCGAAEMAYAIHYERNNGERHNRILKRKWKAFLATCISCGVCLCVAGALLLMRNQSLSSNFDYWMQVAAQSVDPAAAEQAYIKAAEALPSETRPFLGLVELYRLDGTFSEGEEKSFQLLIAEHQASLAGNPDSWGDLCFNIGKLYWYYYDPAGKAEVQQYARVRAARTWMEMASDVPSFKQKDTARTYAEIAAFNSDIVPLINEGADGGAYGPYYSRLSDLVKMVEAEGTDVMRLETSRLVLDALITYPRKFRADGISKDDMTSLASSATKLAATVNPTTKQMDKEKARAIESGAMVNRAIGEAFVDAGVTS